MMNISLLLKAADFLENKVKETDHEYALTLSHQDKTKHLHGIHTKQKGKFRQLPFDRTAHNELEKNRRAYLRKCLQELREIMPTRNIASKCTMLELLIQSRKHITEMSSMDMQHAQILQSLLRERDALLQRLKILENISRGRIRPGPSVSSEWSNCSAGSPSPEPGMTGYDDQSNSCKDLKDIIINIL